MFTGIVEEIGQIKGVQRSVKSVRLTIAASKVLEDVKLGDSIATNGVCLTVTEFTSNSFVADVMPETMTRSNLGDLGTGSRVNLERALRVGDRLGGHMVSGHIDGTGRIIGKKQDDNAIWIQIEAPPQILKYIIEKGSVAIDGISLTVAYVDDKSFKVSIIPHTKDETTLVGLKDGSKVNLENDLTAKYIEKFLFFDKEEKKSEKSSLTMNLLEEKYNKNIPVIAAGGIYTGEDIYKFIEMGASAVQMGTRFVATDECDASQEYKDYYINAKKEDVGIIKSPVGMPGRAIFNSFLRESALGKNIPLKCEHQCIKTCDFKKSLYCISKALIEAQMGNIKRGFAFAGSNVYRLNSIVPVKDLFNSLIDEYKEAYKKFKQK